MKQKNFLKIVTLFMFTIFTINSNAQSTIYSEDFTGQDGKGAIGSTSGATTDLSGVDWTIDISSATLSANTDWFKVTNEIFEARDIDGNTIWQSKSINISGFSNVSLSLSAVEVGGMESSDIFKTEYRIDGGTWTPADTNGSLNDDFTSATVSQTGLSGSTLEIRVTMNNGAASEYHRLDDILVEGTASSSPTIGFDAASSSQTETDETFNVSIPVAVSNYGTDQIDVSVALSGSAEVADYTLNTASLSFTSDGSQNISLDINPDIDDYDDETITLTLTETSSVSGLVISQSTHTLTLADDESAPSIGFDTAASSETETDITFTSSNIPITVSNYSDTQIDINVSITGGTAEAGDYTFTSPTALSFSANETQNIIFDINDDADTDAETIIFTITETSAVSGLVISQSTHTVTITDDEIPPVPVAGAVFITEVLDSSVGFNNDYLELFNNSNEEISLSTSKLIRFSSGGAHEYTYDFGTDESTTSEDITIPAYGFIIIARGNTRAQFDSAQGTTLNAAVKFNGGNTNLFFGNGRRWKLKTGGTADIDDGTLIDDTLAGVGSSKDYRNIFTDTFITETPTDGTPGALEYLVYNGGAWVNTTAMDGTTAAKDAYIYDDYTVSANAAANNIGVNTGKTLTVNSSIGLDVDGNLTVNGNMSINSGGSLIVSGTSTGNVTYNRNLAITNWYLMSSPVAGETYDDAYVTANSIASGTGDNRGIALYTPSDDSWDYMQSGETATFAAGNGYSVKRSATGDISFTGTLNVADVGVTLSNAGNRFNLLGNPYTSHIASATFLTNEAVVSETQTLWVWNQATGASGAYEVITVADAMVLAPAQAFFVKANAAGGTFNFAESNQASTGGTFQRTENRPEIYLTISNQTDAREAKIYYIENMTTGFDVGYEGELFNGVSNPLAIYTHLVADSEGKNYQVQSLPTNNYENMIVPVGVNATSGSAITINASTNNLPEGVNIYLEDKQDNSFTLLNADTNFNSTLENDLSGIGRFYLHTTSESLSTAALGIDSNISIYKSSSDNIRIVGVQNGTANVQMYNMLGKEVLKTSFEGNGVNDIKLINISTGVYILKIALENGTINKKIIIQ